jgi:hypothetical protein
MFASDRDLARPRHPHRLTRARGERRSRSPYGLASAPPAEELSRRPSFRPALTAGFSTGLDTAVDGANRGQWDCGTRARVTAGRPESHGMPGVDAATTLAEQRFCLDTFALEVAVDLEDLAASDNAVRGAFLRGVLLGLPPSVRRVRVQGGHVTGVLDLQDCALPCALTIERAIFDDEVILKRSHITRVELAGCTMRRLDAQRMALDHSLVLRGSTIEQGIALDEADAPGGVDCRSVSLPSGGLSFIRGTTGRMFLSENFRACGPVDLTGSRIAGGLDCSGITIEVPGGIALVLQGGEAAVVLMADATCVGEVRLRTSRIPGGVLCNGTFNNPDADALSITEIEGGQVHLGSDQSPLRCSGSVNLSGSTLASLGCGPGRIERAREAALDLTRVRVAGNLLLHDLDVVGRVALTQASIGGIVHWGNLQIDAARSGTGEAVAAVSMKAAEFLIYNGCELRGGSTAFIHLRIEGGLTITESSFSNPTGIALGIVQSHIERGFKLEDVAIDGGFALNDTHAQTLDDDLGKGHAGLGSWGNATWYSLAGLSYDRLVEDAESSTVQRHKWVRSAVSYDPGVWHRLADVYRREGRDGEATATSIAMQNDRMVRAGLPSYRRMGHWLLRVLIGHGYRPWLAVAWALLVITAFATVVSLERDHLVAVEGANDSLQPLVYSADTFLPVIDFGLGGQWIATGWVAWVQWTVILIGWLLSTVFVAGFTRIVRS